MRPDGLVEEAADMLKVSALKTPTFFYWPTHEIIFLNPKRNLKYIFNHIRINIFYYTIQLASNVGVEKSPQTA